MRTAAITGASSGIGAATARALAGEGYRTVLGARRLDRLEELAAEIGGEAMALDVTDPASVESFAAALGACDVLVNNAGGALGLDPIAAADEEKWLTMYEANVMGQMRMTRALLPRLIESGGSPRSPPAWSRPSSPWSVSAATRTPPGGSTTGCSR
jgi:NADP-dependent 3-hydroxy acid dehydrogenase YdfG